MYDDFVLLELNKALGGSPIRNWTHCTVILGAASLLARLTGESMQLVRADGRQMVTLPPFEISLPSTASQAVAHILHPHIWGLIEWAEKEQAVDSRALIHNGLEIMNQVVLYPGSEPVVSHTHPGTLARAAGVAQLLAPIEE